MHAPTTAELQTKLHPLVADYRLALAEMSDSDPKTIGRAATELLRFENRLEREQATEGYYLWFQKARNVIASLRNSEGNQLEAFAAAGLFAKNGIRARYAEGHLDTVELDPGFALAKFAPLLPEEEKRYLRLFLQPLEWTEEGYVTVSVDEVAARYKTIATFLKDYPEFRLHGEVRKQLDRHLAFLLSMPAIDPSQHEISRSNLVAQLRPTYRNLAKGVHREVMREYMAQFPLDKPSNIVAVEAFLRDKGLR